MPRERDRAARAASVHALQRGIESADELLVPPVDLDDEAPEVVARRARIQARVAEERSRRALAVATEVEKNAWTKDQHRRFAEQTMRAWGRMRRRFYVLLVTATLVLTVSGVVAWQVWGSQARAAGRLDANLHRLAELAVVSCETRNAQLRQQVVTYRQLAATFAVNPDAQEQALIMGQAQQALPEPVDCSQYARIAEQP